MRFFFYGTLLDPDLASGVLGRRLPRRDLRPARLCGWRRRAARDVPYPIVLRCRGGAVAGCVLGRVTPAERDRLCAYEGGGYALRRSVALLAGRRVGVWLFAPLPWAYAASPRRWHFARWRRADKRAALAALTAGGSALE